MVDAFALADVPDVDYAVPATRKEGVFIDEFHGEDSVVVAEVVPARRFEIVFDGFSILVEV